MSTTALSETLVVAAATAATTEPQTVTAKLTAVVAATTEVEFAKCDCCGLTEECTPGYIGRIRERYQGKWVCGLCAEAVKEEMGRGGRMISTEEAMARHLSFCKKFRSAGPPSDATVHLISAVRRMLRRSFDSPRSLKSMPSSPRKGSRGEIGCSALTRSGSCIPSLSVGSGHVEEEENKNDQEV